MKKPLKWIIPLSAVAIVAVVAAVALILHLSNPDPIVYEPGTVIYQDDQVTAKVVAPTSNQVTVHSEWISRTAKEIFGDTKIIAKGTIKNIREVKVSYDNYGKTNEWVYTFFDFHISEYLKNTSSTKRNKQVLTVGWLFSSYYYSPEVPTLEEGKEYIFFFEVPAEDDPNDALDRKEYTDVWVANPALTAFKKGDQGYSVNPVFLEYFQEDRRGNISANLENSIKEMVREYWEVG